MARRPSQRVYPDGWLFPRRMRVSASSAEAVMRKRLTAFNTGVAPSRIRPYIMMVRGASEPTSISVVLKFSKDMRKAIAAEALQARADRECRDRDDVGELAEHHERQPGTQEVCLDPEQIAAEVGEAA